jgi:hypothetical protein
MSTPRRRLPAYDRATRSYSRTGVRRLLRLSWAGFVAAEQRGWLVFDRRGRMAWREAKAFVQTPLCWLLCAPEQIADPLLRAHAMTARIPYARWRWYSGAQLAALYYITPTGMSRWRRVREWPTPDAWVAWQGAWWIWLPTYDLPAPPELAPRHTWTPPARNALADYRRALGAQTRERVRAAIEARGGMPQKGAGRGALWADIAADLGIPLGTVRGHGQAIAAEGRSKQ